MAVTYTDDEIARLLAEEKPLPVDWQQQFRLSSKRGHDERELSVAGGAGSQFRVIFRKNRFHPLDFSVILVVEIPQSNRLFRLRRYNGKSHEHTNQIEGDSFYDFHIHMATERYQLRGGRAPREDAYAEVTDRYGDANGALACMIEDAGFISAGPQRPMFWMPPEV